MRTLLLFALLVLAGCGGRSITPSLGAPEGSQTIEQAYTTNSPYSYAGCGVYTANDWFTTNLITGGSSYALNTIDPRSSRIIANYDVAMGNPTFHINGTNTTVAQNSPVNLATNATPLVQVTRAGCNYMCHNDVYNDDPAPGSSCTSNCSWKIRWRSGFIEQGLCTAGDCRDFSLNTDTCVDYETYTSGHWAYTGSAFNIEAGSVHNLRHSYNVQMNGGPDNAEIPYIGTALWGEDAALSSIRHIIEVSIAGTNKSPNGSGGWVLPARYGNPCSSYCAYKLPMGARLRLKSSYACPSAITHPQASKICIAMKTYGIIVIEHNGTGYHGTFGPSLQRKRDGTNPWHDSDVQALDAIPLTAFDVMTLGTVH